MATPSTSLATLRPELAGSFMEFNLAADRAGFVGLQAAPVIEVAKSSGDFGKVVLEQLLQTNNTDRTGKSGYNRGDSTFTKDNFNTSERGWEEPVDDRNSALYREYIDAEQHAANRAFDFVLRDQELRIAALLFNATTYTGATLNTSVTTEWSNFTGALPITDVQTAAQVIWDNTGIYPDTLVINRKVFRNLRQCDAIKESISSSGAGFARRTSDVTVQQLKEVFDLPKILVAGSAKNTADEGLTASLSPIWSDEFAFLCKTADTNDISEACVARTFHWGEDGSDIGGQVESYRDETVRADIVRVRQDVHEKILYTGLGHLLDNITA